MFVQYECQNYIRVVELKEDKTLHVCGTNAFLPRCRTYAVSFRKVVILFPLKAFDQAFVTFAVT